MARDRFSDRRVALLLALLVILIFADIFFFGRGFYREETAGYSYPLKKIVRDVTFSGEFPYWNPALHAGQPLAANPAYNLFYPPQWLIYLPNYAFAFQLLVIFHFFAAILGMYAFLRSLECRAWSAAFGAVAFALTGPFLSLTVNLPFLFAMTWIPLVLLFARRLVLQPNRRDFAWTALFFGLQALTSEPTTVLQTAMLAGSYPIYRLARDRDRRIGGRAFASLLGALLAGLLVAAVQLGPGIDHAADSVRSEGFEWRIASNWSTPPSRIIELFFPRLFHHDGRIGTMYEFRTRPFLWHVYLGMFTITLAVCGLASRARGRLYVAILLAVFLVLAIGSHTPVFRLLFESGLLSAIRYPEKFLLGFIFVIVVWSALTLDRASADSRLRRLIAAVCVLWTVAAVVMWLGDAPSRNYWLANIARGAGAIVIAVLLLRRNRFAVPAMIVFTLLDVAFLHNTTAARISREYYDEPALAASLPPNRGDYRLFHVAAWDDWEGNAPPGPPDESPDWFSRNAMMPYFGNAFRFRGALEDDVGQTALMSSTRLIRAARQVKHLTEGWAPFFLSASNVTQLLVFNRDGTVGVRSFPPAPRYYFAERVIQVQTDHDLVAVVADNRAAPRDAFVQRAAPVTRGNVSVVHDHPGDILLNVTAAGPGLLVSSNTFHKYWRASIDGKRTDIVPVNIGYQGVIVPPGPHRIDFTYRNPLILWFALLSLASIGVLSLSFVRRRPAGSRMRKSGLQGRPEAGGTAGAGRRRSPAISG